MVKTVTDAYMQQLDLNGRINKKVREVWAEDQKDNLRMDLDRDGAPAAAGPPADTTALEVRLRRLEQLFAATNGVDTIDPNTQPAFAAPPPLPASGNFAIPFGP